MALTGDISGSMGKSSIIGITGSLDLTYDGEGTEDGWIQLREMTGNPGNPGSDQGKIFVKDNGSGTTLPYFIDSSGNVSSLISAGGGGSGSPAGSDTQVQYNNGGSFGGASGLIYDDSNVRLGIGTSPSTTLHVLADASSAYAATIDNDNGTNGHGLKITSDGTGTGTYLLDIESASTTHVRFRGDGRIGMGKITSLPEARLTLEGAGDDVALSIDEYIQHTGDSDTNLRFQDDIVTLMAGGVTGIQLREASYDYILINSSMNDVDTYIYGQNGKSTLFKGVAEQDHEQVLILSGGSADSTNSGAADDVSFFVSGSINAKNFAAGYTGGVSLFNGDLLASGTAYFENNIQVSDIDSDTLGTITIGDPFGSYYSTLSTGQYGRLTLTSNTSGRDGQIWLDSGDDIILDVQTGGTLEMREAGTSLLKITPNSSNIDIQPQVANKDIRIASQSGNTLLTADSSEESLNINRKFGLGMTSIMATGTIPDTAPVVMIINMGGSDITGTLNDPTFDGQLKVIVGMQMSSGNAILSYKNAGGGTTSKTLTNSVGVLLMGFNAGSEYRWLTIGDVS